MGNQSDSQASSSSHNWSEPMWSERYQQWYTQRIRNGKTEYNWIGALPQAAAGQDDAIPRSQQHVDHITQGVEGMNIAQAGYGGGQQYTHQTQQAGGHPGAVDPSQSHLPADSIGGSNSFSPSTYTYNGVVERDPPIGEGKGKARAHDQQHVGSSVALMQGDIHPIDPGFGLSGSVYGGGGSDNLAIDMTGSAAYRNPYPEQFGYDTAEGNAPVDGGFDQAVAESRSQNFGQTHPGEASSYSIEHTAYEQPTIDPNTYSYAEDEEEDEGTTTLRGISSSTHHTESHISGTGGSTELLDPRFVVEYSYRYQPGEVLKILWSEPRGAANSRFSEWEIKTTSAGPFYVGYRRFIVVRTDEGHSTCIPISTYEGKACTKNGVRASKHGIVYELARHKRPPKPLKKEPELGFEPVAIEIYADNEKLQLESRANYSKLVTIEHNVKVFFIGRVAQQHLDYVQNAVNECWSKKKTERSTRKHRK